MANVSQSEILLKKVIESLYEPIFKKETEFLLLSETHLLLSYTHIISTYKTSFAISEMKNLISLTIKYNLMNY